jgi:outer membrane protein assembly factor BamD
MFKSHLTAIALALSAILLPCKANAWLWGLFGHEDDKWRMMEPAQQDKEAWKLMDRGNAALYIHNDKLALKCFNLVSKRFPVSKYASDALYNVGKINMRREKWKKAFKAYSTLIKAYPENPHFNEMIDDMFYIGYAYESGINIHYLWWIPYHDRTKAINVYENLVGVAPCSDYASTSLIRIAMLHYRMHELVGAVDATDRVLNDYPNSIEAPNATILMAELMSGQVDGPAYDQGATNEAINYYRDFLTLYPTNPAVKYCEEKLVWNRERYAKSRFMVGEFFYKYRDDYDSAAVFFNDSITTDPDSEAAAQSRVYLEKIAKIKERFPNGDWPRRNEWQYLNFWHKWDPLTEPVTTKAIENKKTTEEKKIEPAPSDDVAKSKKSA